MDEREGCKAKVTNKKKECGACPTKKAPKKQSEACGGKKKKKC